MIYLSFKVDNDTYAIAMQQIIDVVPAVPLKAVPTSPVWLAGLLNFRQQAIPVIDLNMLATGKASTPNLGRRIALLPYIEAASSHEADENQNIPSKQTELGACFGIMANMMVNAVQASDFTTPPQDPPVLQSSWLGEIVCYQHQWLQLIQPQAIINDDIRHLLQINQADKKDVH